MDKLKVSWDDRINKFNEQFKDKLNEPDKIYTEQKVEGYWYSQYEPDYPMPIKDVLTQAESDEIYNLMIQKQKKAKINKYFGCSTSRLTGEMLGNVEYELDGWRWTGNLDKHYVKEHRVKPSDEFLTFIGYPNKNETKATLEIKYNCFKSIMRGMVEEISKEIDKEIVSGILLISEEPNANGVAYSKQATINAVENFNQKNLGEPSHSSKSEMEEFKNSKDWGQE